MRRRVLIALALVAAAISGSAGAAHAQCGPTLAVEESLARTEIAFVGQVVDRSNRDRTAVMEVLEIWKGRRLPQFVTVNGGPEDLDQFTSIDRSWLLGQIYLVIPANAGSPFRDSLCSATQLWTTPTGEIPDHLQAAVGNISPIGVLTGESGVTADGGPSGVFGSLGVAIGVLALALAIIWGFRRLGSMPKRRTVTSAATTHREVAPTAAFKRRRRRMPGISLSGLFTSKRGSRLERVRKATRRGRRGPGEHEREQLERAVNVRVTMPPSRRNHYTSRRRAAK
jgi:hypothetical protein